MISGVRAERKALTVSVGGNEDFPAAPLDGVVKEIDGRIKKKIPHENIRQVFELRPMWTRNAILQQCGIEENVSR